MYKLPMDYVSRPVPRYFDDTPLFEGEIVYQPEVYSLADVLCSSSGRSTVIDIGCGCARKLLSLHAPRRVGVDFGSNIEWCRKTHESSAEWIEADLSADSSFAIAELVDDRCIVICSDVIEHLPDPVPLVRLLTAAYERGAIVITSTPDRCLVRGVEDRGPPPNPSHVREWELGEYREFLLDAGLPAVFAGHTIDNNVNHRLSTILTVHAPNPSGLAVEKRLRDLRMLVPA